MLRHTISKILNFSTKYCIRVTFQYILYNDNKEEEIGGKAFKLFKFRTTSTSIFTKFITIPN